ncbi:glucosamine-6-phosphate isomerase [Mycotypha africana]|uniref:glucosamine-6-phosphate isomerase n=1 Tax=Mycotypha africana TaxID=64632 RepID=UPI0023003AD4|nr:glucosamine-6-phosphate isomerase [Mycotypha africana]KAI8969972.1 glucosamine-6-phosphate isomerase [Mycotypha africana]
MRLIIRNDYDEVSDWVAHYIKERINQFAPTKERPFVLGLPTGSSPMNVYKRLAEFVREGKLSFVNVITFNMDEYVGLNRSHKQSYYSFMWKHLFQYIDIPAENINFLDGNAPDLEAECRRYEAEIARVGGIELFIGGIGPDGHIAFNEPGSSLTSRTRVKTLAYETIIANTRFFEGDITKVPKLALTVGVATVMDAREVCVIITGAHRSIALAKAVEEGINHMWTVSAIQMHPKGLIVCDEDATLELHVKTVKYFKSIEHVHELLIGKENLGLQGELLSTKKIQRSDKLQRGMLARKLMKNEELLCDSSSNKTSREDDDEDGLSVFDSIHAARKRRRIAALDSVA